MFKKLGSIRIVERYRKKSYLRASLDRAKTRGKVELKNQYYFSYEDMKARVDELNKANNSLEKYFVKEFKDKYWANDSLRLYRNHPALNQYFVDFLDIQNRVAIELDGPYHETKKAIEHDRRRDKALSCCGFETIRLSYKTIKDWELILWKFYKGKRKYKDKW